MVPTNIIAKYMGDIELTEPELLNLRDELYALANVCVDIALSVEFGYFKKNGNGSNSDVLGVGFMKNPSRLDRVLKDLTEDNKYTLIEKATKYEYDGRIQHFQAEEMALQEVLSKLKELK